MPTVELTDAETFFCAKALKIWLVADEQYGIQASEGVIPPMDTLPAEARRQIADLRAKLEELS